MFSIITPILILGIFNINRMDYIGGSNAFYFVLLMAISVFTSLFLFQNISNFIVDSIEDKVDISVYFEYEVLEDEILDIKKVLSHGNSIFKSTYTSRTSFRIKSVKKFSELINNNRHPKGLKAYDIYQYKRETRHWINDCF